MQKGELIGVIVAAPFLAIVLDLLHKAYTFGSTTLPAPQAGLMALMSRGIVGGEMAWPLFLAGMLFAVMLILVGAPSPMLVAVGMYIPIWSTFAIFIGGVFKWLVDSMLSSKNYSQEQTERARNTGILVASGFVAGEALMGVLIAGLVVSEIHLPVLVSNETVRGFIGLAVFPLALWLFYRYSNGEARKAGEKM